METARTATLVAATISTGLISGLFYAFSIAVMPGLARGSDRTLVETMQNINKAILNGWFILAYLGAPVLTTATLVLHATGSDTRDSFLPLAAALAAYVASMIITARINIPLNNALEQAGPAERLADPTTTRTSYEAPWNKANTWRTLLTTLSLALLSYALTLH